MCAAGRSQRVASPASAQHVLRNQARLSHVHERALNYLGQFTRDNHTFSRPPHFRQWHMCRWCSPKSITACMRVHLRAARVCRSVIRPFRPGRGRRRQQIRGTSGACNRAQIVSITLRSRGCVPVPMRRRSRRRDVNAETSSPVICIQCPRPKCCDI